MSPLHRLYRSLVLIVLLAACGNGATREPAQIAIATPDPLLATPQPVLAEGPLQGQIPEIPNIFIVPSRQSKPALAAFLKTTPEQLDWVNPGLADPIAPGTLVLIPAVYRTSGETLSEVSQKTGLSEDLLRAANPNLKAGETLEGKVLAVPALYIVPADTLLTSTAATLATSSEALLSANPELAAREEIVAGTVLVVLPKSEAR